jgi:hypothetical protein
MTDLQWAEWLRASGGTGAVFLGVFVVGLVRKWWVLGWIYEECRLEKVEWKNISMRQTGSMGRAVETVSRVVETQR